MAEQTPRRARRQLLVEKQIQFQYVGMLVVAVLAISIVMTLFVYASQSERIGAFTTLAGENEPLIENLRVEEQKLLIGTVVAMLLNVVAVGVIGFAEIHKIAGPIYRLTKSVQEVKAGDYTARFMLRSRDLTQDLASGFRDMMEGLRKKVGTDLEDLDGIGKQVKIITDAAGDAGKIKEAGKEIEKIIARMHEEKTRLVERPSDG